MQTRLGLTARATFPAQGVPLKKGAPIPVVTQMVAPNSVSRTSPVLNPLSFGTFWKWPKSQPVFGEGFQFNIHQRAEAFVSAVEGLQLGGKTAIQSIDKQALTQAAENYLIRLRAAQPYEKVPLLVGIAGGSASGKSTFTEAFHDGLESGIPVGFLAKNPEEPFQPEPFVSTLNLDNFYHDTSAARAQYRQQGQDGDGRYFREVNFDTPKALDLQSAREVLQTVRSGKGAYLPFYRYSDSVVFQHSRTVNPAPFVLVDGMFALSSQETPNVQDVLDIKIFVDTPEPVRKARWMARAEKRGVAPELREAYYERVRAMHDQYIEPSKTQGAQIVLNGERSIADIQATSQALAQVFHQFFTISPYPTPRPRTQEFLREHPGLMFDAMA